MQLAPPALPLGNPSQHPFKEIKAGFVYTSHGGEQRLVVGVDRAIINVWYQTESQRRRSPQPVITWRTADPNLSSGFKSQGSATLCSFVRWASTARIATKEDWVAFDAVQRQRSLSAEIRKMMYKIGRAKRLAKTP
jgi:hypothetical protein